MLSGPFPPQPVPTLPKAKRTNHFTGIPHSPFSILHFLSLPQHPLTLFGLPLHLTFWYTTPPDSTDIHSKESTMNKNMGATDRMIRMTVAILIGILLVTGTLSGVVVTVLGIFAIIFILTSVISFCPLYMPFKISTRKGNTPSPQKSQV
jgi:hypothetical protein